MKVLIIADSLAMPRNENQDIVNPDETWPTLISALNDNVQIQSFALRARVSRSLNESALHNNYLASYKPDVIIIQIGVVDSMPRIISLLESRILNKKIRGFNLVPAFIREHYIRCKSSRRGYITARNPLAKVHTKPNNFKKHFSDFIEKTSRSFHHKIRFIIIPILINEAYMEQKSPGAVSNKNLYNSFLREMARFKNVQFLDEGLFNNRPPEEVFCSDGYHLNPAGNRLLAEYVSRQL